MIPLPWSHSALSDFKNCQRQYYHKRVAKDVVDLPNDAGLWGDYVHKEFEKYLRAWNDIGAELPKNLSQYEKYLDRLASGRGEMLVECKYAINRKLEPCDWFAKDVWCRAVFDVLHLDGQIARIIDHKTGKRKTDTQQLKLSALICFLHHPDIVVVKTGYFWLLDKKLDMETFVRVDEAKLWQEFLPDLTAYKQAYATMTFMPRKSGLCNGWCPVTGCEFWQPKRAR